MGESALVVKVKKKKFKSNAQNQTFQRVFLECYLKLECALHLFWPSTASCYYIQNESVTKVSVVNGQYKYNWEKKKIMKRKIRDEIYFQSSKVKTV